MHAEVPRGICRFQILLQELGLPRHVDRVVPAAEDGYIGLGRISSWLPRF